RAHSTRSRRPPPSRSWSTSESRTSRHSARAPLRGGSPHGFPPSGLSPARRSRCRSTCVPSSSVWRCSWPASSRECCSTAERSAAHRRSTEPLVSRVLESVIGPAGSVIRLLSGLLPHPLELAEAGQLQLIRLCVAIERERDVITAKAGTPPDHAERAVMPVLEVSHVVRRVVEHEAAVLHCNAHVTIPPVAIRARLPNQSKRLARVGDAILLDLPVARCGALLRAAGQRQQLGTPVALRQAEQRIDHPVRDPELQVAAPDVCD